ncbi:hypothetical protein ACIQGZ_09930 [Streptomyces sp. NPDC092296]|uniref:hypothetical protein n=1 Tax=Streptomyces sp. NPDC092296 TaxID=3366012 RepID=UPI00380512C8
MAVQFAGPVRRRRRVPAARRAVGDTRHPLVAAAIVVPCAVLLTVAFGGWHQLVVHTQSVAALVGR